MFAFKSLAHKTFSPARNVVSGQVRQFALKGRDRTKPAPEAVENMSVQDFYEILNCDDRKVCQIIDVREKDELKLAHIPGKDIINLPLQNADAWMSKVLTGNLLKHDEITIIFCHHGVRSMRMAKFLTEKCNFLDVFNVEGGIHKYATECDKSIGTY